MQKAAVSMAIYYPWRDDLLYYCRIICHNECTISPGGTISPCTLYAAWWFDTPGYQITRRFGTPGYHFIGGTKSPWHRNVAVGVVLSIRVSERSTHEIIRDSAAGAQYIQKRMYSRCTVSTDEVELTGYSFDRESNWVSKRIRIERTNERTNYRTREAKRNEMNRNEMNRDETRRNESRRNESKRNETKWIETKRETKRDECKRESIRNENVLSTTTTYFIRLFRFRGTAHNCGGLDPSAKH